MKTIQLKKAISDIKDTEIKGKAIDFNSYDLENDVIPETAKIEFAEIVDLYFDHDHSNILASTRNDTLKLYKSEKGVFFKANLLNEEKILKKVKTGLVDGVSCGFDSNNYSRNTKGGLNINHLIINEVSLTHQPMNNSTIVKSKKKQPQKKQNLTNKQIIKML